MAFPDWPWLTRPFILALHDRLLADHGGAGGIRDDGLLDSALARPRQKVAYGEPDVFDLAAAYAAGFAGNHPFVDGNKRVALMAAFTFLRLSGCRMVAPEAETVRVVESLAGGALGEEAFADWLRANSESGSDPDS